MREVQALVLVAFISAAAIVIVCVLQARAVVRLSKNVATRDELQLSVDRRAHLLGAQLGASGLGPNESLSERLATVGPDDMLAQTVQHVSDLPVLEAGLAGAAGDEGHMVLVDGTNGQCVANGPARRMTAAALKASPVNLNDLYAAPKRQNVTESEHATSQRKRSVMPKVKAKVAAGGGHISYTAAGASGKKRWSTYFAGVPGTKCYLGASAPA
jgi:hypothetical protein